MQCRLAREYTPCGERNKLRNWCRARCLRKSHSIPAVLRSYHRASLAPRLYTFHYKYMSKPPGSSGASSRGVLMMEPGAAPAPVPRKHRPGRPRVAVRSYYGGPPSVAGRERRKGGESRLDQGCDHFPSAAGRTAPGTETAASNAGDESHRRGAPERRACFTSTRCAFQERGMFDAPSRRSAPPHLRGRKKRTAEAQRRKSQGKRSVGCLTLQAHHTRPHPEEPA